MWIVIHSNIQERERERENSSFGLQTPVINSNNDAILDPNGIATIQIVSELLMQKFEWKEEEQQEIIIIIIATTCNGLPSHISSILLFNIFVCPDSRTSLFFFHSNARLFCFYPLLFFAGISAVCITFELANRKWNQLQKRTKETNWEF